MTEQHITMKQAIEYAKGINPCIIRDTIYRAVKNKTLIVFQPSGKKGGRMFTTKSNVDSWLTLKSK